jgi:hypothetical protein
MSGSARPCIVSLSKDHPEFIKGCAELVLSKVEGFKPLNGLGAKCSNGSSSSRRFAPFHRPGLEHLEHLERFSSLNR